MAKLKVRRDLPDDCLLALIQMERQIDGSLQTRFYPYVPLVTGTDDWHRDSVTVLREIWKAQTSLPDVEGEKTVINYAGIEWEVLYEGIARNGMDFRWKVFLKGE